MPCTFRRCLCLAIFCFAFQSLALPQTTNVPLTEGKLLGLVAGAVLPQNIVHAVQTRNLAFRPTDKYRELLTTAGADDSVQQAVAKAKTQPAADSSKPPSPAYLQHLADAGKLLRASHDQEAAQELVAAVELNDGPETGFIMAQAFRHQKNFAAAAQLYQQVLERASYFTEAHTKLSYISYLLGDYEQGLREATAALEVFPDNPEAHKNAALSLANLQKPEAAIAENREALRLKPDYAAVHNNLALIYEQRKENEQAEQEFAKAISLEPKEEDYRYNYGTLLNDMRKFPEAVRQLREAKKLDPSRIDIRQNLGAALLNADVAAAIREFHELIAMAPDFEYARVGLGAASISHGDYEIAASEYRQATVLDPSDPIAFSGLGHAIPSPFGLCQSGTPSPSRSGHRGCWHRRKRSNGD